MKPPYGYPGPKGYPCGQGWKEAFIVTGEIPQTNGFGKSHTRTLAPIVVDLQRGGSRLGWDGEYETERREQMLNRGEQILAQLRTSETLLSPGEVASIEWLLGQAIAELDATVKIHDQWKNRAEGTFPLWYGDKLKDFPSANGEWCTDPDNVLSPPGPQYGVQVPGRDGGKVICPTRTELKRRPKDRRAIADHFVDAAHHLRCAEYGLWRLRLYRQALADWYNTFWAQAPDDLVARPKQPWQPGKVIAQPKPGKPGLLGLPPIVDPPPPNPPGEVLPPAAEPVDPATGKTGPEGLGGGRRRTRSRRRRKKSSSMPVLAATAAAVTGAVLLSR